MLVVDGQPTPLSPESPATEVEPESVSVAFRQGDCSEVVRSWDRADVDSLASASPWRTFRWYKGQKHFSGTFWSATVRDHVIYESRLELARLLFADFDTAVRGIVAQPFLLTARVDGATRKHIPDYLLVSDNGPVVVDVKPQHRLSKPKVAFTLEWTRQAVTSRGWRYEVASEPPPAELENIRFLAGFRRDWLHDAALLDELRSADLAGATLRAAFGSFARWPEPVVRSAVLHLLWRQHFVVDLARPLSASHVLERAA